MDDELELAIAMSLSHPCLPRKRGRSEVKEIADVELAVAESQRQQIQQRDIDDRRARAGFDQDEKACALYSQAYAARPATDGAEAATGLPGVICAIIAQYRGHIDDAWFHKGLFPPYTTASREVARSQHRVPNLLRFDHVATWQTDYYGHQRHWTMYTTVRDDYSDCKLTVRLHFHIPKCGFAHQVDTWRSLVWQNDDLVITDADVAASTPRGMICAEMKTECPVHEVFSSCVRASQFIAALDGCCKSWLSLTNSRHPDPLYHQRTTVITCDGALFMPWMALMLYRL